MANQDGIQILQRSSPSYMTPSDQLFQLANDISSSFTYLFKPSCESDFLYTQLLVN